MMLLAVNFHYVEDEARYPRGGIYPTPPAKLETQIDELGRFFEFVGQQDILRALRGERPLPSRACVITFDDGLASQYANGLPVLERKGVPAIFFTPTLPLVSGRVCTVHKIHWLRAHLSASSFSDGVREQLEARFGHSPDAYLTDELKRQAVSRYRYDEPAAAQIKFLLNNMLKEAEREAVMDAMFARLVPAEADFVRRFYLSSAQLTDLHRRGFLGLHSHAHLSLRALDPADLDRDIFLNKGAVERLVGGTVHAISYPYGSPLDVDARVAGACRRLGLAFGFTMERAFNAGLDEPMLLARADTNDVPGGKRPAFRILDGALEITGDFAPRRAVYLREQAAALPPPSPPASRS